MNSWSMAYGLCVPYTQGYLSYQTSSINGTNIHIINKTKTHKRTPFTTVGGDSLSLSLSLSLSHAVQFML